MQAKIWQECGTACVQKDAIRGEDEQNQKGIPLRCAVKQLETRMSVNDLRITEIMYNPPAGSFEFIEITNTGTTAVSTNEFFVGNADFGPQFFDGFFGDGPTIPAGATIILVPAPFDFSEEVFEPPVPITQAEFEAVYGPLPAGAIYLSYVQFAGDPTEGNLIGNQTYTIGGIDIFGDSVFIPDGAAIGQSASVSTDGTVTFGTPTPGSIDSAPVVGPTAGNDVLFGGNAPTTLNLLDGDDTWTGVSETDVFVVGQYIDEIRGGLGNDSIFGGLGNDRLWGDEGNDLLDFGDGNDNGWGGVGDDALFGGTGLDRLNGNSGNDSLYGGNGADIMRGGKGEDYMEGGDQADKMWGGAQSDEIYGGKGNDVIKGQNGADLIYGGSGGDVIDGGTFDDIIHGDHGNDTLNGGSGNDEIFGGKSNDVIDGDAGNDDLFGGQGNDTINGGTGDDVLDGGRQSDVMDGGDGEDILIGDRGDDVMTGGADADTFVFAGVVNHDVITDFEVGVDTVDLTAYGPMPIDAALAAASQTDAGVLIDLKGNGSVLLSGVALDDLQLADILFVTDDIFAVG